ncbi:AAA family ATPase [Epidermidibacterium keratini]|uniref:AAA family ATPase n=1 Tax=Epidermidibacterium keratini TaxID=1891644 RepID=A0A7L4YPD9_9ACTN|nr:RNA polymerase recycling motor ATPase HelR [Epidermidibacterium keratini]QHC00980.1 AAA family ATPase [Epidermidibacterium keratini]
MTPAVSSSAFDLPDTLAAKADPALISTDEAQFSAIAEAIDSTVAEISQRLDAARQSGGRRGTGALERDQEVQRLTARLRTIRRYGIDLCLGRMVIDGHRDPVYVGRVGLSDREGRRLLVDWRSVAAEPFFAATHANPMGLRSRRRYRWSVGRISDYWDEVFTADGLDNGATLDDQSAFIASLATSRSPQMRDVLATIASDQDAIIRASSRGTLVVDGGPGTGKTVVALHRAAYLLYSDPRLGHERGGVLFVGPHEPYLAYVADVLPSLGEEGVQMSTLRDLVPQGADVSQESDPEVAALKSTATLVQAIEPAVRFYEEPPTTGMEVELSDAELWLSATDWAEAFAAPDPGTPHNLARERVLQELVDILLDKYDGKMAPAHVLTALEHHEELLAALHQAWPLIGPTDLVADLYSVPAYLRKCAPWLRREQVLVLQRTDPRAWTLEDLPMLDAARQRLGDPHAVRGQERKRAVAEAERERMSEVVDDILAADDDGEGAVTMLRGADLRDALADPDPAVAHDPLAGPFAHIIVDEAQELTDAQWQMLLLRNPSRSFTVVGDRAQARHGFTESWSERLERVGLDRISEASLSINYRTPSEIMAEAEPVIRAALPDANVPTSIRSSGLAVIHGDVSERDSILQDWLSSHADGIACVIGDPAYVGSSRVRSLTPELAKGLEFDLVIVVRPDEFGGGIEGAVDRYVAMTRATGQLAILT